MHFIPLFLIIAAGVAFVFDYARTKALPSLGLALLTAALTLHFVIETAEPFTLG